MMLHSMEVNISSPHTLMMHMEPDFTPYLVKLILPFLDIRSVFIGCSLVSRGWLRATKFHSGLRLHTLL
jgi:hypothetical protein